MLRKNGQSAGALEGEMALNTLQDMKGTDLSRKAEAEYGIEQWDHWYLIFLLFSIPYFAQYLYFYFLPSESNLNRASCKGRRTETRGAAKAWQAAGLIPAQQHWLKSRPVLASPYVW